MANGLFTLKQVNQALRQSAWTGQKTPSVQYLVVAGGGSGGGEVGGGGGAGGLLTGVVPVTIGSAITVTVGAGGSGASPGANGANSVFGNIAAVGGGRGGYYNGTVGLSGGSGGGGGGANSAPVLAGNGISGQGNAGGNVGGIGGIGGGGGGGAGTVGLSTSTVASGQNGGAGVASAISGTVTTYAGGGGGGRYISGVGGIGGVGGGGDGSATTNTGGTSGGTNTGGGGGGTAEAGGYIPTTASGGSGIVILSYPDTYAAAASTSNATVTTSGSGSAYFNGTNQVLVYNSNNAFQFGSGNFTWEAWVNYLGGAGAFFDLGSVNSAGSFAVFITGGVIYVRIDGLGNDLTYTYPIAFVGNWVHLAVVRNGTTLTLYYNGVSVASGTRLNNITQNSPYIGNLNGTSIYYFGGYLSNNRVVKGTAVYTANFTPSTSPLTAISGTSLLLNTVSGAYLADGSTNGFAPTTGTVAPTWNSASPFATGLGYKNRVYTWTTSGSITF